jgi:hypothetical protein
MNLELTGIPFEGGFDRIANASDSNTHWNFSIAMNYYAYCYKCGIGQFVQCRNGRPHGTKGQRQLRPKSGVATVILATDQLLPELWPQNVPTVRRDA